MSELIREETQKKLESLCENISVSRNLDDEIRRELLSHMEDKLSGYLDGGERVTEEDAFILVKEHFGDPAVIRALFQEVEGMETNVSFWRKLAVIASFTIVTMELGKFLFEVMLSLITYGLLKSEIAVNPVVFSIVYKDIPSIVVIMLFFYFLVRWKRQIAFSQQTWFENIKTPYLYIMALCSMMLLSITVMFLLKFQAGMLLVDMRKNLQLSTYSGIGYLVAMIAMYFGWLYWFDMKKNRLLMLSSGFLLCMLFEFSFKIFVPWFTGSLHNPGIIFSSIPKLLRSEFQYTFNLSLSKVLALFLYLMLEMVYSIRQKMLFKFKPKIAEK